MLDIGLFKTCELKNWILRMRQKCVILFNGWAPHVFFVRVTKDLKGTEENEETLEFEGTR